MDALSRTLGSTALLAFVLWPAPSAAQSADAQNVIDRATEYVRQFVNGFVNVVAEERYVQTASPNQSGSGPAPSCAAVGLPAREGTRGQRLASVQGRS